MENEKCPVCQAALILEEDGHKYGCYDCYFGCDPEDLPRIAAAMDLARAEEWYIETEHFNWSGPTRNEVAFMDWSLVNYCAGKALDSAQERVLEAFGGE